MQNFKTRVLLVEDEELARKTLAFYLNTIFDEVILACDGEEALLIIKENEEKNKNFDLILTDLNMPNVDGFELISSIRGNDSYRDLPIIVLSSLGNTEDIQRGLECGANSYLVKPFDPKRVVYEVSKYLN